MSSIPEGRIRALVVDSQREVEGLVHVPILYDGILPDVPKVIYVGNHIALLEETNPLRYKIYGKAHIAEVL